MCLQRSRPFRSSGYSLAIDPPVNPADLAGYAEMKNESNNGGFAPQEIVMDYPCG
ncbi:hypothetical protein ABH944_009142 [Caballeronia udeis]|uniref:Uncharacterized protein n=1 Tax=Caballeronia udeis TaxID=1232866 RepID=A0ABW8MZB1_9BURK